MLEISPPTLDDTHPDRQLQAESALDPAFNSLCDQAIAAGWQGYEVDMAVLNLAVARLRTSQKNLKTENAIRRAIMQVEQGD